MTPVLYINAKVMATNSEVQRGRLALMALHGDEGGRRRRCMAKAAVVPHREATAVAVHGLGRTMLSAVCFIAKAVVVGTPIGAPRGSYRRQRMASHG